MHKHTDQLKMNALRLHVDRAELRNSDGRIRILPYGTSEDDGAWRDADRKSVAALWRLLLLCALLGGVVIAGAVWWAFSLRG